MKKNGPVHIQFDALDYRWVGVPQKKYDNYLRMRDIQADPDNFKVDGYPYMLQIEPTNMCNLKCPLCPAGTDELERERRHMPLDEFRKLIDDMQDYLLFLILWEWGEPFMHPQLPEMIKYVAERDIKTVTSTNAHFLNNEEYLKRILTSGLTTLIVAIDSLEQKRYTLYRKSGKLSKALKGLENLVRLKKKLKSTTRINLRMVIMKQNEHELPSMRRFAKEIGVDEFTVKSLNPSCGLDAKDDTLVPTDPNYRRYAYHENTFERVRIDTHCNKMWFMCSISANGEVIPCGYDYTSALKVGHITETPLSQIWNSPEAQRLRKRLMYEKEFMPKCYECSINYKLSEGGWFPETIAFDESPMTRIFNQTYGWCRQNKTLVRCADALPNVKRYVQELAARMQ
ncbi:MAG: radical SAM protein [Desulfobulbaceae bacterium]|nr:radical SAM protein [Desulfobulbaceae bacterium]